MEEKGARERKEVTKNREGGRRGIKGRKLRKGEEKKRRNG